MKRITLALMLLLFLISVNAIEDFTPDVPDYEPPSVNAPASEGAIQTYNISYQNASRIVAVQNNVQGIRDDLKNKPNRAELETFKQELVEQQEQSYHESQGEFLSMLLIFTIFFFAMQFILKAKGWL